MATIIFDDGTVTLANGGTLGSLVGADISSLPVPAFFVAGSSFGIIESINVNGDQFTLSKPWGGAALAGSTYEILYGWANYSEVAATLAGIMERLDSRIALPTAALTEKFIFSSTTTDADPGDGKLRLSHAAQSSTTVIYVDLLDYAGVDLTEVLDGLAATTTATIKGFGRLIAENDSTRRLEFNVTGLSLSTGYRKLTIDIQAATHPQPFGEGEGVLFTFTHAGPQGAPGDRYDIPIFDPGKPGSAEELIRMVMSTTVTFPVGMTTSRGSSGVASTGAVGFSVRKNDVDFAIASFSAGASVAAFSCPSATTFAPGDVLTVIAPISADATLARTSLTLTGSR